MISFGVLKIDVDAGENALSPIRLRKKDLIKHGDVGVIFAAMPENETSSEENRTEN